MSQELLDVLDETGQPTGRTKTKAEIIRDGDWRKVVHIWIVDNQQQLLVQQRAAGRGIFDNLWDVSVGGGVATGEPSQTAAQREVNEELGLELPIGQFLLLGTWKLLPKTVLGKGVMRDFSDTFLVRLAAIDVAVLQPAPEEVQATDTVSLNELQHKVQDPEQYANWVQHGPMYYREVSSMIMEQMRKEAV